MACTPARRGLQPMISNMWWVCLFDGEFITRRQDMNFQVPDRNRLMVAKVNHIRRRYIKAFYNNHGTRPYHFHFQAVADNDSCVFFDTHANATRVSGNYLGEPDKTVPVHEMGVYANIL